MLMDHSVKSSADAKASDDFAVVLGQAKAGEAAAWRRLFDVVSGRVVAFLVARGAEDPDGVAGDVFFDIVRSVDRFSGDESAFVSWAITSTHRRLVDSYRTSARHLEVVTHPAEIETIDPVDVAEAALGLIAAARARELLGRLTADQADVLALRIYGDLTLPEIAAHTGKPLTAVKSLQHRALQRLRRLVESE